MGTLEFIASVLNSVAWPLALVIIVVQFRKAIAERITSILKISHKDTEVVFDHTAREVEAAIATAELPTATPQVATAKTHVTANTGKILAAWMELENAVGYRGPASMLLR